jgi:hypothetical protein
MAETELRHSDFIDIYNDFADTPYGADLAGDIRYAKYNLTNMPPAQWAELLGPDVNNLAHMRVTYQLTQSFVRYSQAHQPGLLAPGDPAQLLVAAISHDQGEALIGDISYGDKTVMDTAREQQQFAEHASEFTPTASGMLKSYLARARDEIIFDHTSRLGRMFNAIERIGYLRTALKASEVVRGATSSEVAAGLRWLVADVLSNQVTSLLIYAEDYAAVNSYLTSQSTAISEAFELVSAADFEHYSEQREFKLNQFATAEQAWQSQTS